MHKNCMIRTPQKYYSGNEINENETGRAYSMHWGGRGRGGGQEIDIRGFGKEKITENSLRKFLA